MTLKLAQFCDDPKISTKSSYPQKILIFLKTPKNIEIQNFEPQKMGRAYECMNISEYPPPPPPPLGDPAVSCGSLWYPAVIRHTRFRIQR